MLSRSILVLLLSGTALAQTQQGMVEKVELMGSDYCAATKRSLNPFAGRFLRDVRPGADPRALNNTNTDLTHYDLDIVINTTSSTISGSNVITFTSLVNGLTNTQIRLSNNFTVSGILCNGVAVTSSRLDSATLQVNLNRAYNIGEVVALKISYSGTPTSGGSFGSITFRTRSGAREAFTLSETDYAYTWFPVKDTNLDKSTADMKFTVTNPLKVASNGLLVSTTPVGGTQTQYYYKTDYPTATYLYCFAVTNFNTFSSTWNFTPPGGPAISMPVNFWIYPENDTTANRNVWLNCVNMLTAYSQPGHFGTYPFANEKYGIYNFGFGGGMEHQTSTGEGVFVESVTSHELGHQWWGDMITCADWHHIWLNEGFATYTEALWAEWKPGSSGTPALLSAMSSRRPSVVNDTVWCPSLTDMNRIFSTDFSYRKGGWVLHQLRHVMGDTAFFQGMAAYRAAWQYGAATTEDFQAAMESVYGSSLNWFFQEWVYQPGAPAYGFSWKGINIGGQDYLELYFSQTQSASYPTYRMPLDIVTTPTAGGPSTTNVVVNDARAEHLLIKVSGPVGTPSFDPGRWVLWTQLNIVPWTEGPPKVVGTSPVMGASGAAPSAISVTFHKNVNASAPKFAMTGPGGSVPFSFGYDVPSQTATLTPTSALAVGTYTVTALDTITDVAANKQLDGETTSQTNPAALPSGEGLPGGSFSYQFTVTAPPVCVGDIDGNLTVDTADLTALLGFFGQSVTPGTNGDLDGDGTVGTADLTTLLGVFGTSCP